MLISNASWSVGKRIFESFEQIKNAKSKREVELICLKATEDLKNKDAKKFMYDLYNCRDKDDATSYCYNYYLAGIGLRSF